MVEADNLLSLWRYVIIKGHDHLKEKIKLAFLRNLWAHIHIYIYVKSLLKNSGTGGTISMKLCTQPQGLQSIIILWNGYHGLTVTYFRQGQIWQLRVSVCRTNIPLALSIISEFESLPWHVFFWQEPFAQLPWALRKKANWCLKWGKYDMHFTETFLVIYLQNIILFFSKSLVGCHSN